MKKEILGEEVVFKFGNQTFAVYYRTLKNRKYPHRYGYGVVENGKTVRRSENIVKDLETARKKFQEFYYAATGKEAPESV